MNDSTEPNRGFIRRLEVSNDSRNKHYSEFPPDDELEKLLSYWAAPDPPNRLTGRVVDGYRREHFRPFWRRVLSSTMPVPIPIAAVIILLLLTSGLLNWSAASRRDKIASHAPPETRLVEVPVLQEKTVIRTVYIDKHHGLKSSQRLIAEPRPSARDNQGPPAGAEPSTQAFTRAVLSGFEPVGQMRIEIIKGTGTNE